MFFHIILNVWPRIGTIWYFKFIIPRWIYYFKLIIFILLSYIFLRLINTSTLGSNLWDKLRTNLCPFGVFYVFEYCLHAFIFTIIVHSRFLFYSQLQIHNVCDKINFMYQIIVNIFRQIKIKIKSFGLSYYNHMPSIINMTWLNFCKVFQWFHYVKVYALFIWFRFSVCFN